MAGRLAEIWRYPVKSLNGERLERVVLRPGAGLPEDRRFAIAHGGTRFEGGEVRWRAKDNFLNLMRNARLAKLEARYDAETAALEIFRDGKRVAGGRLDQPIGRQLIEQFLAAFMGDEVRGTPKIVAAEGVMFGDTHDPLISIQNLASIADIERVARATIDPRRFRGNLYCEGLAPWQEMNWPGRELRVGDVRFRVVETIERCAAINVDPATGERDLNLVKTLGQGMEHVCCGIYAEPLTEGGIAPGDPVELIS